MAHENACKTPTKFPVNLYTHLAFFLKCQVTGQEVVIAVAEQLLNFRVFLMHAMFMKEHNTGIKK